MGVSICTHVLSLCAIPIQPNNRETARKEAAAAAEEGEAKLAKKAQEKAKKMKKLEQAQKQAEADRLVSEEAEMLKSLGVLLWCCVVPYTVHACWPCRRAVCVAMLLRCAVHSACLLAMPSCCVCCYVAALCRTQCMLVGHAVVLCVPFTCTRTATLATAHHTSRVYYI